MRALRVYHGGRDPQHRLRERALTEAGVDVTLVVPDRWPDASSEARLSSEAFPIVELGVRRPGDVNRHTYESASALRRIIDRVRPDVLDVHEEPVSLVARQWLAAAPPTLPVVLYTAQNIDKRFPPPFHSYERKALARASGVYPCSRQAAAVVRAKGCRARIAVLPLGYDDGLFVPAAAPPEGEEVTLVFAGRLVPEKGVCDAVEVLARMHESRPTRLLVCGDGPESSRVQESAAAYGVSDRVELRPWLAPVELAAAFRDAHVVLVPSRTTPSWAEQFGRVIVEAQASGTLVAGYASGAIPETAGEPGALVPTGDAAALAGAILRVLDDPVEWRRSRDTGLGQSESRTWQAVAERQARLYHDVVAARSAPEAEDFGATAATPAGLRPFALPVLRTSGPFADGLAMLIDACAGPRNRRRAPVVQSCRG